MTEYLEERLKESERTPRTRNAREASVDIQTHERYRVQVSEPQGGLAMCDTPPCAKAHHSSTFIMRLRIAKNLGPSRAFVKKSAKLSAQATKGTTILPDSTTSRT